MVEQHRPPPLDKPTANEAQSRLTTRSIRSFVVRNGRLTRAQEHAVSTYLPHHGIPYSDQPLDLVKTFGRDAPVWLEIGFGNGDALLAMAQQNPHINLIGVEIHTPGIGQALMGIESSQLSNIKLIQHDAMDVLQNMLNPSSLAKVLLFFPDPWRKKRHHKRRIVQQEFLNMVSSRLAPAGVLHCATDWADYADWMQHEFSINTAFTNTAGAGNFSPRPDWRPLTRFEQRGHRLGHEVRDLIFQTVGTRS